MAFAETGVSIEWKAKGVDEKGYNKKTGAVLVEVDARYFRPAEVELLIGDYSKAKQKLGWEPKYSVEELCKEMVQADVEIFKRDKLLAQHGHSILNQNE